MKKSFRKDADAIAVYLVSLSSSVVKLEEVFRKNTCENKDVFSSLVVVLVHYKFSGSGSLVAFNKVEEKKSVKGVHQELSPKSFLVLLYIVVMSTVVLSSSMHSGS